MSDENEDEGARYKYRGLKFQQARETARKNAARKLHPELIRGSAFFTALLGYLLQENWATPCLVDVVCTSDNYLLGRAEEEIGHNRLLCTRGDLVRNVLDVADYAKLTPRERTLLLNRIPTFKRGAR